KTAYSSTAKTWASESAALTAHPLESTEAAGPLERVLTKAAEPTHARHLAGTIICSPAHEGVNCLLGQQRIHSLGRYDDNLATRTRGRFVQSFREFLDLLKHRFGAVHDQPIRAFVGGHGQIDAARIAVGVDVLTSSSAATKGAPATAAKGETRKSSYVCVDRIVVDMFAINILDDAGDF